MFCLTDKFLLTWRLQNAHAWISLQTAPTAMLQVLQKRRGWDFVVWAQTKHIHTIQHTTIDKMTCSERLPKCNNFALSLMRIFRDWSEKNNFLAFNRLNNGMGRINAQLTIKLPVKLGQINTIVKYSHWGPYLCSACLIVLLCLLLCFIKKNLYPIVEDNRN